MCGRIFKEMKAILFGLFKIGGGCATIVNKALDSNRIFFEHTSILQYVAITFKAETQKY